MSDADREWTIEQAGEQLNDIISRPASGRDARLRSVDGDLLCRDEPFDADAG